MSPADYLRELAYPLRSSGVLIAMTTFVLLSLIVVWGYYAVGVFSLFGIWLGLVTLVALIRYLMMIADARAQGLDVAPPGAEYFSLIGNLWTLWPALIVLSALFLAGEIESAGQPTLASVFMIVFAAVFPAMIAVLTLTHSPFESINPLAIARLIGKLGPNYLYAVMTGVLVVAAPEMLGRLPAWIVVLVTLYFVTAFFAVIGGLTRATNLVEEVGIPEAEEPGVEEVTTALLKKRTGVLNHAYGFASRGNRDNALNHIEQWIEREDPEPAAARQWFFERMLDWEETDHALFFAQRYLSWLLAHGEQVRAVKLILRGQIVNPRFRPKTEDMEAAIEAAQACRNPELADALRRL